MKIYKTHDNGGRPFAALIKGNEISVYINPEIKKTSEKPIYKAEADKIFIGKKSSKGGYDGMPEKEAAGNSILVQEGDKYVFIGHEIYSFAPMKDDTIEKFYSDIGRNDVSYPYAVGENYIYILTDSVAVEKEEFDLKKNIYQQYYMSGGTMKKVKLKKKVIQKRL